MIFTNKEWEKFCEKLDQKGIHSMPADSVLKNDGNKQYLILKHDVETNVSKAYKIAQIEHKYGHKGSYYVQAYLLKDGKNTQFLTEMKKMGHEISYHYDVMDSNQGDIDRAIIEFSENLENFKANGFICTTVCQHGNPVVKRSGYHSNRDFFRNIKVKNKYPELADIMVDFKHKARTEYLYFSDAGRKFNLIYDPINNDIINSEDKNISYNDLTEVVDQIDNGDNCIISIHPHRWSKSRIDYLVRTYLFKVIKWSAKQMSKVPFFRKIMERYYYLAKKI